MTSACVSVCVCVHSNPHMLGSMHLWFIVAETWDGFELGCVWGRSLIRYGERLGDCYGRDRPPVIYPSVS